MIEIFENIKNDYDLRLFITVWVLVDILDEPSRVLLQTGICKIYFYSEIFKFWVT